MLKKIVCALLCVFLCGTVFTGCDLITHNDSKDAQQIIVTINPITDSKSNFTSDTKYIYKSELISQLNSNLQSYMQQNSGATQAQAVDYFLKNLVQQKLLIIEADRLLAGNEIVWTQKQTNQVQESVYDAVDSQLATIRKEILSERNESTSDSETEDADKTETTYPVKEDESSDEDYTYYQYDEQGNVLYLEKDGVVQTFPNGDPIPAYSIWTPDEGKNPANWGTETEQSLGRETIRRFVTLIRSLVKDDFRLTKANKTSFVQDDEKLNALLANEGTVWKIYGMIGSTHYVEYLLGTSAKDNVKLNLLKDYITESATVTEKDVADAYEKQLSEQKDSYKTLSNYQTAVTEGTANILYNPNDDYFYVKHILLPFSDEQTAALKDYKAKNPGDSAGYYSYRDETLVSHTVVYPHVNGEDDKDDPRTVQAVFNEIYAAMSAVRYLPKEAERTFDDLIYKYNTDKGIFDKAMGYAVKRDSDDNSGYMEEFYKGAMELYEDYGVGQTLPHYVVTDYGVHIMYFANTVTPGVDLGLYDYQTPGQYKTYYELLEETIKTNKENTVFGEWANRRIFLYTQEDSTKVVEYHAKRYKDLLGED